MASMSSAFLVSRQNDSQVLSINGTMNQLYLEVNISNTATQGQPAEDAHNSLLNISIPTMFMFSGVRTKVLKVSLLCKLGWGGEPRLVSIIYHTLRLR